jgi:hypothetical protein
MNKETFITRMLDCGDGYVNYTSTDSAKQKYYICTLNFKTKYVRDKYFEKYGVEPPTLSKLRKDKTEKILCFCWDLNEFKSVNVNKVTSIVPLSTVLGNR